MNREKCGRKVYRKIILAQLVATVIVKDRFVKYNPKKKEILLFYVFKKGKMN
jgi:hypothetical protein